MIPLAHFVIRPGTGDNKEHMSDRCTVNFIPQFRAKKNASRRWFSYDSGALQDSYSSD